MVSHLAALHLARNLNLSVEASATTTDGNQMSHLTTSKSKTCLKTFPSSSVQYSYGSKQYCNSPVSLVSSMLPTLP